MSISLLLKKKENQSTIPLTEQMMCLKEKKNSLLKTGNILQTKHQFNVSRQISFRNNSILLNDTLTGSVFHGFVFVQGGPRGERLCAPGRVALVPSVSLLVTLEVRTLREPTPTSSHVASVTRDALNCVTSSRNDFVNFPPLSRFTRVEAGHRRASFTVCSAARSSGRDWPHKTR